MVMQGCNELLQFTVNQIAWIVKPTGGRQESDLGISLILSHRIATKTLVTGD